MQQVFLRNMAIVHLQDLAAVPKVCMQFDDAFGDLFRVAHEQSTARCARLLVAALLWSGEARSLISKGSFGGDMSSTGRQKGAVTAAARSAPSLRASCS